MLDSGFLLFVLTNKNLCLKPCVGFYSLRLLHGVMSRPQINPSPRFYRVAVTDGVPTTNISLLPCNNIPD